MALLDEIGKTLTDKGREAAQKAKEMAEVLQMKAQVSSEKSRVKDLYSSIGKVYYEECQKEAPEQYADAFTEIGNVLAGIAELEEKISQLDGSKTCPACKAVLDRDAAFCSKCGVSVAVNSQELTVVEEEAFEEQEMFEEEP